MKESIEYFYSINIDNIFFENGIYHFLYDNYDYFFKYSYYSNKEINDLLILNSELLNKGIDSLEFVRNINNKIITQIDDKNYILIKGKNIRKEFLLFDIIDFSKKLVVKNNNNFLDHSNWGQLWQIKIDYIENQLNEIGDSNIIHSSIDYYIGLTENAIYYFNLIKDNYSFYSSDFTLSHRKIKWPNIKLNYLNPMNYIIDYSVRDISEYIKEIFWNEKDAILELETYLKVCKLNPFLYNMLFIRLIYPSYYFDIYEKILNDNGTDEELLKYISGVDKYEAFLKEAYFLISKYASLENIKYLIVQD